MFMHFLMPFDSNETLQKELPWPKLFEAYCFDANEASQPIFSDLMSNLFWWFWCRQNNRTIGLQMAQWIADSLDARKTSSASLEVSKMSKSILAFQHRLTAPWHVYEARVVFNSAWRWQTSSMLNARANELLLLPSTCFLVYNILWSYDINTFKLTDFETWCWGSVELKNTEYCSHVVFQARLTSSIELDGWFSCHTFVWTTTTTARQTVDLPLRLCYTGAATSNTGLKACWSTLPMTTEHRGKQPGGHDTESCINASGWISLINVLWFLWISLGISKTMIYLTNTLSKPMQLGYGPPIRELSPQRRLPLFL